MSEFDKEAEREKLREKYAKDQQDREATERMSDLLLKGATMTNAHCGTCGDPIFRYEGQEFCPSCQEVITESEDSEGRKEGADQPQADAAADASDTGTGGPETGVSRTETGNVTASQASTDTPTTDGNSDTAPGTTPQSQEKTTAAQPTESTAETEPDTTSDRSQSTGNPPQSGGSVTAHTQPRQPAATDESLADARASLTRTVTRLAQQADASEELERVRAYLAATEEAAAALEAVKRADR